MSRCSIIHRVLPGIVTVQLVMQGVSERASQWCSKCYCVASVTKTFTLKGVQTIHRSTTSTMHSLYAFKCKCFRNTSSHSNIWNSIVKLFLKHPVQTPSCWWCCERRRLFGFTSSEIGSCSYEIREMHSVGIPTHCGFLWFHGLSRCESGPKRQVEETESAIMLWHICPLLGNKHCSAHR
jgi:hypothetical protein